MVRAILVVVLVVGLLAAAVLGPRWLMRQTPDNNASALEPCNLITDTCQWWTDGVQWQVSLEELAFDQGLHTYRLQLQTETELPRLHAVLRGESMYLGEYPVVLKPGGSAGQWQATFSAPLCTVQEVMLWRLDLLSGGQQALEGVPFKLVFEARAAGAG